MRAEVDDERCRGHGICVVVCPDVFQLNDDGYAESDAPEIDARSVTAAREAAVSCPERAITVT
ncbi:ferredoxin [Amycolatopsis lurida]